MDKWHGKGVKEDFQLFRFCLLYQKAILGFAFCASIFGYQISSHQYAVVLHFLLYLS